MSVARKVAALTEKACSKCDLVKPIAEFYLNKTGYSEACDVCVSVKNKEYYEKNKDRIRARKAELKEQREAGEAPEKDVGALQRRRDTPFEEKYADRRQKRNASTKARLNNDITAQINRREIDRFRKAVLAWGTTLEFTVGCSIEQLEQWLTFQFTGKMSLENYGTEWNFDHVKPRSMFDFRVPAQVMECNHWSNLRPIIPSENSRKGNRIDPEAIEDQATDAFLFEIQLTKLVLQGNNAQD